MSACIALATISFDRMAGGLERNIVYLANHLAGRGDRVLLLTFDRPDARLFYDLDPRVVWLRLGRSTPHGPIGFRERLALIRRIRRALVEQGVGTLVCFHHGILLRYVAASALLGIRTICSERNSLTIYDHIRARKWNLNFLLLFFVDAVTVQFQSYVARYPRPLLRKIHVIHNPVFPPATNASSWRRPLILSVGRHVVQKRFDLLVRAFYLVSAEFPAWRLVIVGDGPLKDDLQRLTDELGLTGRVELSDPVADLSRYFAEATIYCQPSQWEGFPNAQAEAMSAGVIPVGFAATSGVADLIEDGRSGVLVRGEPTAENLAAGLRQVMASPATWPSLRDHASKISESYSPASWQAGWNRVLAGRGRRAGIDEPVQAKRECK